MNFKISFGALMAFVCSASSLTATENLWLRYPAISPDGKNIAFSFRGDLWLVEATGGRARQLTTHENFERHPVWSPDSGQIVFASNRHGNDDLFIIPAEGGSAKRLTFHSSGDTPTSFTPDGKHVLFTSFRQDAPTAFIGHASMGELYRISISGGRAEQILTTPAEDAHLSQDSQLIAYHDYKGYEDRFRKHHVSSVARDVWIFDTAKKTHQKLTEFRGEDREPVWSTDGKRLYYLSEKSGSFNVWRHDVENYAKTQITKHATHPVRYLSIAQTGTLAYSWNGQLWVKPHAEEPQRLDVQVVADNRENAIQTQVFTTGATEAQLSPDEDEIAFVVRGEVFVTSIDYATTKTITNTPQQERSITWSKDGRTLYYAGERDGAWNLYGSSITRDDEPNFSSATLLTEETVLAGDDESFQPLVSPDGEKIAYLHNRDEIRVLDLATKKSSVLVPAKRNYSYADGDIRFDWSPDSKWLAFTYASTNRWLEDVGIVNLATAEITNVSNSGYAAGNPVWSRDGKALLFVSDRYGRRNHGSWGTDDDIIGFYLTREAWEWINLSEEDWKRKQKAEEKDQAKKDKNESAKDEEAEKEITPLKIDVRNVLHRQKRLTLHSAPIGGLDISPDGETLVYFAQVENKWDLWISKIRPKSVSKLASLGDSNSGSVRFAKDGKSVFIMKGSGGLAKVSIPESETGKVTPIAYEAEMQINFPAERRYIFEHAWRQVKRKFYKEDLHGVDWEEMRRNYEAFLPGIATTLEFTELLGEMLGELNASHTGGRYRPKPSGDQTPSLGMLFETNHRGAGLKVAEVLKRGPADRDDSKIRPGVLITHVDGDRIEADTNPYQRINNKLNQKIRLGLSDPKNGSDWEELITPISLERENNLLYERWIETRRILVDKLSNGRVGYVHVRGMNDPSFRRFYHDVLGTNSDKEALIVDTRYNGGGWLHDDLVSFLSGQDYIHFQPRGKQKGDLGAEPAFRWSRPTVVVQSESNYSDAHMFPFAFKQLKLGKLIGTPVPGTGTAVWWERQIHPEIIFGIPQVGMVTPNGEYLENLELKPDIEVYNSPESVAQGKDLQIEKAVEELLRQLGSTSNETHH